MSSNRIKTIFSQRLKSQLTTHNKNKLLSVYYVKNNAGVKKGLIPDTVHDITSTPVFS